MESINGAHLIQRIRERCEQDFKFFVRYFFKSVKGSKFVLSDHHDIICNALEDVFYGRTSYLIINMPPRYSKTEIAVKMFTAWCYVKNPKCDFIHLSYADILALDNSETVKQIIKSTEFKQLWPDLVIKPNKDSKKAWGTEQGGVFYATSAGGPITGFGAGKMNDFVDGNGFGGAIIIDDPLKPDDAYSDPKRESVNRRWDETIKSRFNSRKTPCIVIMQRIHELDFCGMLLKDSEYKFTHLVLPAIVDEGKETERPLWPAKHDLPALYAMRAKNSYMFASQMQQMPAPLGGGIIKGAWFKRYSVLPPIKYKAVFVDTAQKAGEHNDYQVAELWALGEDGNLYMVDILRDKFMAYELETRIPDFWNKHKADKNGRLRYMAVEDKSSGTELIQKIQHKLKPRIPIRPIPRGPKSNKLTRVMDVQGYIESGYIYLPDNAPWVSEFIAECESFTADDTHAHDDQIDPMCDAISQMLHNTRPNVADIL